MTDPIYGDNPIDPDDIWYRSMRPPLVNDAEIDAWRRVVSAAMLELLESSWLVRWRTKSPVTALGAHLNAFGSALAFPRPDGWDDDRYQPVVVAIDGATLSGKPPQITAQLAESLLFGGQTWEMSQPAPASYVVTFYSVTDDEAILYREVMQRGRKRGIGFTMIYSTVAKADTFVLDVSLLDGPDILAVYA